MHLPRLPFPSPGKPNRLRTAHLEDIPAPVLILQGDRDPFGRREVVEGYTLSKAVRIHWLTDGEHSFKPRKSSDRTARANWNEALEAAIEFLEELRQPPTRG